VVSRQLRCDAQRARHAGLMADLLRE